MAPRSPPVQTPGEGSETISVGGRLVDLGANGVGIVDVWDRPQFVYFRLDKIAGYRGETIGELRTLGGGGWAVGRNVVVSGHEDEAGALVVDAVALES